MRRTGASTCCSTGRAKPVAAGSLPVPALLEPVEYLSEPAPADPRGSLAPALRRHAAARLPEHMVPGAFVFLDRLPLGPTGKLNTRALPEPGDDVAVSRAAAEPPRTPLETTVAGIWAEVLGIPAIGIRDNFFEVGGHSLLATRVIARVRAGLGVEVPLRLLFERPNVADFALALAERLGTEAPVADDTIPPADRSKPLPLSYAQQRLWFLDRLLPGSGAYNVALGLRLDGDLDEGALRRALTAVIRRHENLRTRFPVEDGRPRQEIMPAFRRAADRAGPLRRPWDRYVGPGTGAGAASAGAGSHRPGPGAAASADAGAAGAEIRRAGGRASPRRHRRLVDGRAGARGDRALPGGGRGHGLPIWRRCRSNTPISRRGSRRRWLVLRWSG